MSYSKEYHLKHKESDNARVMRHYYADHEDSKRRKRESYHRNKNHVIKHPYSSLPEEVKERKRKQTREGLLRRRKLDRHDVFLHYSNGTMICFTCGEKDEIVLCIDHINGGGNQERKIHGGGWKFYVWLKKQNYPEGYQVLCYNCNARKHLSLLPMFQ
jgi:hypothetical protein